LSHDSFVDHARFRWLKGAALLCIACAIAYVWHEPPIRPYGGTWLGYTLCTITGLLILWLLWFGIRKRRYARRSASLRGWLSAHVYLGVAVVVIATLHTGFELGWNIHGLAYVLMVLTVASGLVGVYFYATVPALMTSNRGQDTLDAMLLKISDLDRNIAHKALSLPDELLALVNDAVHKTRLGGSFGRILSGRDPNCPTARAIRVMPEAGKSLQDEIAHVDHEVYAMLLRKQELLTRARRDMRFKALMEIWLFFHVPLSLALLAALLAHVVSVFVYW